MRYWRSCIGKGNLDPQHTELSCVSCSGGTKVATGSRQVDMSRTYSYLLLLLL